MKRILMLISLILCIVVIQSKAQKNDGYTLKGQIKGMPDGTKVYLRAQGGKTDTIARAISKGNSFIFKGNLALDGRFHFISIDSMQSKVPIGPFFLENKEIFISAAMGDKKSLVVTGSKGHDDYVNMLAVINPLSTAEKTAMKGGLKDKREALAKERNEAARNWITSHPASLFTPKFISMVKRAVYRDLGTQVAYDNLTVKAKTGYYGMELKKELEVSSKTFAPGVIIPNFTIASPDGKKMNILDIAATSKYTLIDCWASWCSPCRSEVPMLKRLYATYKNKGLNIVGVSSDDNEVAWAKALKEDETTWTQGIQKDGALVKIFGIKSIPAYILIDSKGKLIAFDRAMGNVPPFGGSLRGEALDKKLEELLENREL